jgi:hypothetical protein
MRSPQLLACLFLGWASWSSTAGKSQQISVPLGDALGKALAVSSLTGPDSRSFHLRAIVSEPENPQSPYRGTVEEWWSSSTTWRREVTDIEGMRQTIVVTDGKRSERDEGDYFPLWLRNFVTGLFDPVPDASTTWGASGLTIDQLVMPNGARSQACVRIQSKIGTGSRATDAFSDLCFDGQHRLEEVVSPRYSMGFGDYKKFRDQQIARKLSNSPEPGTDLVCEVTALEDLPQRAAAGLFTPLPADDSRFDTIEAAPAQLEQLTAGDGPIAWPSVHSGHTSGRLAMYISIDDEGHVREAWPLNSDNAGLDDPARDQVRKWSIPPQKDSTGNPTQIDGGLGFAFDTAVADPIPVLTDEQARQLLVSSVEPRFPAGVAPPGTRYRVRIAVNEQGKVTGGAEGDTEIPGTIRPPGPALFPIMMAVFNWHFRPFIKDGQPHYFFAELVFTVK